MRNDMLLKLKKAAAIMAAAAMLAGTAAPTSTFAYPDSEVPEGFELVQAEEPGGEEGHAPGEPDGSTEGLHYATLPEEEGGTAQEIDEAEIQRMIEEYLQKKASRAASADEKRAGVTDEPQETQKINAAMPASTPSATKQQAFSAPKGIQAASLDDPDPSEPQAAAQSAGTEGVDDDDIGGDDELISPQLVAALLRGAGDLVDGTEDTDPITELLNADPTDMGLQQMALRSPMMLAATPPEDRQNGTPEDFSPTANMAKVSDFLLIKVKDGAGDWDDNDWNRGTGKYAGQDTNDHNHVVRTQDDVTYTLAYSVQLNNAYIYHTIKGARLYVQYVLPVPSSKAEFDLDAMPWLEGAAVTRSGNSQILTGYRDLPDRHDTNGDFDVPCAGTVNCVIHVKDMANGETFTPQFYAWIQKTNSTSRPGDAALATAASGANPTVTVTVGTYLTMTLQPNLNDMAGINQYTVQDESGAMVTYGKCALKPFEYVLTVGRGATATNKGVAPLNPSVPIDVDFTLTFQQSQNAPVAPGGLWEFKSMNYANSGVFGHTGSEHPLISAYTQNPDPGFGSASMYSATNGRYHVRLSGFTHVSPGEIASRGVIIAGQKFPDTETTSSAELETWSYTVTATVQDIKAASTDGTGKHSLDLDEKPSASHHANAKRPGHYNGQVVLTTGQLSTDPEKHHTYVRIMGETTPSNALAVGEEFWSEWTIANIATTQDMITMSSNQYCLWNPDYVELVLKNGSPEIKSEFGSGWSHEWGAATYRYSWITKKDGSSWTNESEMRTASLTSYNDLYFWNSYASVPSGWKVVGMLVETRDGSTSRDKVGQDNVRLTMIHMKVKKTQSIVDKTTMFTHSYQAWKTDIGTTMASSNGRSGTVPPPGDRVDGYMGDRTYTKSIWNSDGSINTDAITSHSTVYEGSTLLVKGFLCRVTVKHEDGTEAKNLDVNAVSTVTYKVQPTITGDGARNSVPSATLQWEHPALMTLQSLKYNGINMNFGSTYSAANGTFRATNSGGKVSITFTGIKSDMALPLFTPTYKVNAGEPENGESIDLTATIIGDGRTVSKDNGNMATASLRAIDIEAFELKETVDKAVVRKLDNLTYTVRAYNSTGSPQNLNIQIPRPKNGDDGTVLSNGSQLTYVSSSGAGSQGSRITATYNGSGVTAAGSLKPGEEATITIVYKVPASASAATDVIRNKAEQTISMETTGSSSASLKVTSNMVETTLEPDPVLSVLKRSTNPALTNGKECWSLAGAVYEVFQGTTKKGELTTDATGSTPELSLEPFQNYTIREKTAPKHYILNQQAYAVTLNYDNSPYVLEAEDEPEIPVDSIKKEVSKVNNSIDEVHTWTVTASVPFDLTKDNSTYQISDILDTRLTWKGNVHVYSKKEGSDALTEIGAADGYRVTAPSGNKGGTLIVEMRSAGREALLRGDYCVLKFDTVINETAQAHTNIPNTAIMYYDAQGRASTKTSNEVFVNTGDISIMKTNSKTGLPLSGAKFALYKVDASGNKIAFMRNGSQYTAASGTDGKALFHGLEDGKYAIRETSTLPGYSLMPQDMIVELEGAAAKSVTAANGSAALLVTGGKGTGAYYYGSFAASMAAVMTAACTIINMKKKKEKA